MSSIKDTENAPDGHASNPAGGANRGAVLLIAQTFPPSNMPGAWRPYRFFKYLTRSGFDVHVVTASAQHEENPRIHHVPDQAGPSKDTLGGWGQIFLRKFFLHGYDALGWWSKAVREGERIFERAPRAILSTSPPEAAHFAGRALQGRLRVPWIADFRDPIAGNDRTSPTPLSRWSNRFVERRIFREADLLIANTDAAAEQWRRRYPDWAPKIRHLWNGFDPDEALAAEPIPTRSGRTLTHVGSIYLGRSPRALVASLLRLQTDGRMEPGGLSLVLHGATQEELATPKDLDRLKGLGGFEQVGDPTRLGSREDTGRAMATSDYLLVLDFHASKQAIQVPSKLYAYLRIGRPIAALTQRGSPTERILERAGVPYVCMYPDDPPETFDANLLALRELSTEPVRASEWFWAEFDGKRQAERLADWIGELGD